MFQSLIDNILGLDEQDLWRGGAAAFKAFTGGDKRRDMSNLNDGMIPIGGNEVRAYQSKPVESVDAENYEAQWLARLNRFANISNTMSRPR